MSETARLALARDISRRLPSASLDETRLVDRALTCLERVRSFRWERRLATSLTDVDHSFHVVSRIESGAVRTRCSGSWPLGDTVETQTPAPRIAEMCAACLSSAVGDAWTDALIAIADELDQEDRERADLREEAWREMTGGST